MMERRGSTGRLSEKFSPSACRNLTSLFSPDDVSKTITPRRKLSLDDSSQSPMACQSLDDECSSSTTTTLPPSTFSELRTPLASVNRSHVGGVRLTSRLKSKNLSLTLKPEKENSISEPLDPSSSSSLSPSLSHSPFASSLHNSKTLLQQINSPLERMTIASPASSLSTFASYSSFSSCSSSSSSSSVVGVSGDSSDGYCSDVFDGFDEQKDSQPIESVPESFRGLFINSMSQQTTTTNETAFPENDDFMPAYIPRRHNSLQIDRKGSLKRCLTSQQVTEGEKGAKRPPVPASIESHPVSPAKRTPKGVTLFRSQSYSLPPCENAIFPNSPGDYEVERIGDHSKPFALPLIKSPKVSDLKSISSETVCKLLKDDYSDIIDQYTIVDCRFPYEYEGGHIKDAINIWEKDTLLKQFFSDPTHPDERRNIIVFHCEFSSKRGPEMCRFMRKIDRERNGMDFPRLYYPELYLLEGGYKSFYEHDSCMCTPQAYCLMLDDHHREEMKHFKKKSKSWSSGDGRKYQRSHHHH